MKDNYDLVGFFLSKDGLLRSGIIGVLEGTPLEESASSLSFAVATFAVVNVVFLLLFFSQFAILWIERKAVARMQDRYGATTALRSLWVGENGVTAGEWWNMLPFGLGKPLGAVNKYLNKNSKSHLHMTYLIITSVKEILLMETRKISIIMMLIFVLI